MHRTTLTVLTLIISFSSIASAGFFDELAKRDPSKIIWKRPGNAPYRKTDPDYVPKDKDFLNKTRFVMRNQTGLPLRIKLSFAVQSLTVNRSFSLRPIVDHGEYQTFVYEDVTGFLVRIRGYDPTTGDLRIDKTFKKPTSYKTKNQKITYFYDVTHKLHANGLPPVSGPTIQAPRPMPPERTFYHQNNGNGRTYTYRIVRKSAGNVKLQVSQGGRLIHDSVFQRKSGNHFVFQVNYTVASSPSWALDATYGNRYQIWVPTSFQGNIDYSADNGQSFLSYLDVPPSGTIN